jgi:hypothetical protein
MVVDIRLCSKGLHTPIVLHLQSHLQHFKHGLLVQMEAGLVAGHLPMSVPEVVVEDSRSAGLQMNV